MVLTIMPLMNLLFLCFVMNSNTIFMVEIMEIDMEGRQFLNKILEERRLQDFGKVSICFFVRNEIDLYKNIKEYVNKYGELPPHKDYFDETVPYPYRYLYDKLNERYKRNRIMEFSSRLDSLIVKQNFDEADKEIKKYIFSTEALDVQEIKSFHSLGEDVLKYIRSNRAKGGLVGIPSGWATLDAATCGFQAGNIYVILSRPKSGKSASIGFMSNSSFEAGYIPMVISMEMRLLEIARRMFALRAGIDMTAVKSGQISYWAEQRLEEEIAKVKDMQPFYFVEGQFKKDIVDIATLVQSMKPHIVYIDGGYLVKIAEHSKMAKWEKISEIAEEMKTLSIRADVPIIVSFQFNRQVKKDRPDSAGFENIQLSDAISQIASVGIGIFEDHEYTDRRRIEIVGGREGERGSFFINWDWERMNFTEIGGEV